MLLFWLLEVRYQINEILFYTNILKKIVTIIWFVLFFFPRFDFKCEKDGKTYLIEVKGVPNASAQDPPVMPSKSKKKKKGSVEDDGIENGDKEENGGKSVGLISYFPDGYR